MLARLNDLGVLKAVEPSLTWADECSGWLKSIYNGEPDPRWGLEAFAQVKEMLAYGIWLGGLKMPALAFAETWAKSPALQT